MELASRVVALGGSVGSIQAVAGILSALPADFEAAILVVIHTSEESPGLLPQIFSRYSHMPVIAAANLPLEAAHAYIAIPGKHMIVSEGQIEVTDGPRENRNRPAIDPMLRSLARSYRQRAIGVVLSGYLDDGTAGLASIKHHGGITIVQDPVEAQAPSMPLSALAGLDVDYTVSLAKLPDLLKYLVRQAIPAADALLAYIDPSTVRVLPSVFTCPECHAAMWEVHTDGAVRLECRMGHIYTSENLVADPTEASESALWAALRSLEEGALLSRRLMNRAIEMKQAYGEERFRQKAEAAERHILELHRMLGHAAPDATALGAELAGSPGAS